MDSTGFDEKSNKKYHNWFLIRNFKQKITPQNHLEALSRWKSSSAKLSSSGWSLSTSSQRKWRSVPLFSRSYDQHSRSISIFLQYRSILTFNNVNNYKISLQGDRAACAKPPVDFKTCIPLWPGQARTSQAKTELMFRSQREVVHKLLCHPVYLLHAVI